MSKIIDAVSIVLTWENEIFVVQRQEFLNAFPGYWAFPGGKVEKDDSLFSSDHPAVGHLDHRLFGAAVREGKEEIGIDLREEISSGRVRSVDYLGLAVTPDFNPYRFATHFFKINFINKVELTIDRNEAKIAEWMSAEKLLAQFDSGQLLAVPPIIKVIQSLGSNPQLTFIEHLNVTYDNALHVPHIESLKGIRQFMPLSHTLPPATRTNAFLIGDDHSTKILIDPSPKDEDELKKLMNTLALFKVDKILLTHHHPDHCERSNLLARKLDVPILLSEYTLNRILKRDPGYFNDLEITLIKDKDTVTTWLNKDILVMDIPGHDEGQVALHPEDMSWFLAGDLFQGIGSVVIGGEEGNMKKYFETLQKIIDSSPKVVFPSHGIGLGGTWVIEKNLKHRQEREAQILSLHLEGLFPEEILSRLYIDVEKNLWPYALENIHKHLEKLRFEKTII